MCLWVKNYIKAHRVKKHSTRKQCSPKPLTMQEISDAEKEIFRSLQMSAYLQEPSNLQKNESKPLPWIGLCRIKHPVVLSSKNHVSEVIIYHFHSKVGHQGMTINAIRSNGLCIQACSSAVSYMISKCLICRKLHSSV